MYAPSLNAAVDAMMPDSNSFAELNRKCDDETRSAGQIKFDEDKAANKALKLGDHIDLINEAVERSSELLSEKLGVAGGVICTAIGEVGYVVMDRIRDACLSEDDAETGRLICWCLPISLPPESIDTVSVGAIVNQIIRDYAKSVAQKSGTL
ncbi:MAG: hypothetical protein ACRBBW_12990 [Cellvibrionaceae bacterium]